MIKRVLHKGGPLLVAMAALSGWHKAQAESYALHQDGFDGSSINISFEASDLNKDGAISAWDKEVSAFSVVFSDSYGLPVFSSGLQSNEHGAPLLIKFRPDNLANHRTQSDEGIYLTLSSDAPDHFVYAGAFNDIPIEFGANGFIEYRSGPQLEVIQSFQSKVPITISSVPEPGKLLFIAIGLTGLLAMRPHRRAKPD